MAFKSYHLKYYSLYFLDVMERKVKEWLQMAFWIVPPLMQKVEQSESQSAT